MTVIDEYGRPEPPLAADEVSTLLGFLDYQRATFAWKCVGVDARSLGVTIAASSMTLGGMLKHLSGTELNWFSHWLNGRESHPQWVAADWSSDPDWDWHPTPEDTPGHLIAFWQESVANSRAEVELALADGGLDRLSTRSWPDGRTPSLRWIIVHMIEEYARHNGHADLIREAIDGETGE